MAKAPAETTSGTTDVTGATGTGTSFDESESESESEADTTEGQDDSTTGEPLECDPNGFGLQVTDLGPCAADEPFLVRACVEFGLSTEGNPDAFHATTTPACGQRMPQCMDPFEDIDVDIRAVGYPLEELVVGKDVGRCGSVWIAGTGESNGECVVGAVYVFDEDLDGLRLAFSNLVFNDELQNQLAMYNLQQSADFRSDNDCGKGPQCPIGPGPGFYAINLGMGDPAEPNGEQVNVFLPTIDGMREMRLVNFGSRIDQDCRQFGKWAAIDDLLDYDIE